MVETALLLPFLLGLGMALPWPFAGAGLSFLPKPGGWMKWVKYSFGVLILLFAVIAGGGFAAWRYTQSQYYVAASGGKVAIFRGINEKVAGMSMSSVYLRTGIPLTAVPQGDRARIAATIPATSLADARAIIATVGNEVRNCQSAQRKLGAWLVEIAHWPRPVKGQRPKPKPPRPTVPPFCPPATAGTSAAGGGTGTATPTHSAGATP